MIILKKKTAAVRTGLNQLNAENLRREKLVFRNKKSGNQFRVMTGYHHPVTTRAGSESINRPGQVPCSLIDLVTHAMLLQTASIPRISTSG
jgi:hypothetical protein